MATASSPDISVQIVTQPDYFSYDDHQSPFVSGSFCGVYHCLLYQLFGFRTTVACSRLCLLLFLIEQYFGRFRSFEFA
ncbi:hypothetical protein LINPERHAP1_LOCUS1773 [Linum perenne]